MAEGNVTPPPYATGMNEKDVRVLNSPDTDIEVGETVLEEKGQLRQGLHQRHIQMIVSQSKSCSRMDIYKHLRLWRELLAPACSWDLVKRFLDQGLLAPFLDTHLSA